MQRWKATGTFIGTDEEDSQTIAYVSDARNRRQWSDEEELAYAHLIAAAPELLEAAEVTLSWLESQGTLNRFDPAYEYIERLQAAIDRAKR